MLPVSYFIIIPLAAAFLAPLGTKRFKAFGGLCASVASFALAAQALAAAHRVMAAGPVVYHAGGSRPPFGIPLVVDNFSAFMLVTVDIVAFLVAVYSTGYVKKYTDTWKFFSLFMLMVGGMNGVLISGDIFTLYVFLEMAALSGYFLVAFGTGSAELEASFKYAVMGTVASIFILLGIGFLYGYASTLNMADIAAFLASRGPSNPVMFVTVLFLMGFGLKAALAPFHAWLPYAHSAAPAPVSAMLSGVSIKVLGIYSLVRILFPVFNVAPPVSQALAALAVISMLTGAVLAFGQSDIKRMFAYSSISQIGFVALGFGIGTPLAVFGSLFYLFNHSIVKSLFFLNSGAIEYIAGTRDLSKIRGLVARSPVVGYTLLAGTLSIAGVPPFGFFWAKLIIIFACVVSGHPFLGLAAAAASVMTIGYYLNALTPAMFEKGSDGQHHAGRRISSAEAVPMVLLACIAVAGAAALLPGPANTLLRQATTFLINSSHHVVVVAGAVK